MPRLIPCSIVLLLCLLSVAPTHAAPPTQLTAPRPVVMADWLGLNAQLHWFEPAQYQAQISKLKALGAKWVRLGLQWDRIEPAPGQWRWDVLDPLMASLTAAGLKPLVYLVGSAPFASSAPAGVSNPDQYPAHQCLPVCRQPCHPGPPLPAGRRLAGVERAEHPGLLATL